MQFHRPGCCKLFGLKGRNSIHCSTNHDSDGTVKPDPAEMRTTTPEDPTFSHVFPWGFICSPNARKTVSTVYFQGLCPRSFGVVWSSLQGGFCRVSPQFPGLLGIPWCSCCMATCQNHSKGRESKNIANIRDESSHRFGFAVFVDFYQSSSPGLFWYCFGTALRILQGIHRFATHPSRLHPT